MHEIKKYHYEKMNVCHFEEAFELWKQSEDIELTIGDTKGSLERYLQRNSGMSFVCFEKETGRMSGTILCGHDGRRGFIYHLAVRKEDRNRSIAKTLIQNSINELKKEGIERCIIMVKTFNETGKTFWDKIGWKERSELNMYSCDLK